MDCRELTMCWLVLIHKFPTKFYVSCLACLLSRSQKNWSLSEFTSLKNLPWDLQYNKSHVIAPSQKFENLGRWKRWSIFMRNFFPFYLISHYRYQSSERLILHYYTCISIALTLLPPANNFQLNGIFKRFKWLNFGI